MKQFERLEFENLAKLKNIALRLDRAEELKPILIPGKGPTSDYKAIWNVDKDRLEMVTSSNYTLVQHSEITEAFVDVLKNLGMTVKGEIINYGSNVRITAWFQNLPKIEDDEHGIVKGIRLINSFDGTFAIRMELYGLRLACSNGMKVPYTEATVRRVHVGNIDIRKWTESAVAKIIKQSDQMQKYVSECMNDSLEWRTAELILKKLFEMKRHRQRILDELKQVYVQKGEKLTRWDVYNAVTYYITHGKEKSLTPLVQEYLQGKASKLLATPVRMLVSS